MSTLRSDAGDKGIFRYNPDDYYNAHMYEGNAEGKWYLYTQGYLRAADKLVEQLVPGSPQLDFYIYPIAFLYRHYLEMEMTRTIRIVEDHLGIYTGPVITHKLCLLWSQVQTALPKIDINFDFTTSEFVGLQETLSEFDQVDEGSFAFRYPENKSAIINLSQHTSINILNVQRQVHEAGEALELCSFAAENQIYLINEARHYGGF